VFTYGWNDEAAVQMIFIFSQKSSNDFTAVLWMHILTWGVAADSWSLCPAVVHVQSFAQQLLNRHFNVIWRHALSAR